MAPRTSDLTTSNRLLVAGTCAVILFAFAVVARRTAVSRFEIDLFRWFNQWPAAIGRPLWLIMQLGAVLGGVLVASLVMFVLRGWRGALAGAVTAVVAWGVAVVTKAWVARGRPGDYLDVVDTRFEPMATGNGYPSGHTAVAFAVATLVADSVPRRWRIVPYGLAVLVGLSRLYFGAHLPFDVVGGAALGIAVGMLARFLLVPSPVGATTTTRGEGAKAP